MGFLSNIVKATIETATMPISIVKDVADVATGKSPENTKKQIERIANDICDGV